MLFSNIEKYKSRIAFIDKTEKKITYNKLIKDLNFIKNYIPTRSIILIFASNSYECILLYIASLKYKFIPILVDEKTDKEYILNLLKIYNPDFLYTKKNFIDQNKNYKLLKNYKEYYLYINKLKKLNNIHKDLALLISTSGTTGSPKLVRLSYDNLFYNAKSIISYLKIDNTHRTITTLPLNHSYGLSVLNTFIHAGGSIVINKQSMTQNYFWKLFEKYSVTSLAGVPFNFEVIKKLKINLFESSYFKYATVAGGRIDDDTLMYFYKLFKKLNKKFIVMYGQTEASPRMSYLKWTDLYNNIGSIGNVIPGGKFYLRNTKKYNYLSKFRIGELVYKGKNVCLGYAENLNDLSKGNENKNILFTGDLAYRKNKNFYLHGRIKRIIKCIGKRVNLDHLELQLKGSKN